MNALHIGTELRRFLRGTLPPLALAVLISLPLIFGGLFVWSYKDPVSGLSRLPVALVNSDTGAVRDGDPVNAGEQITRELLASDQVRFIAVDADTARDGVADGTYYFALEIPADFSEAAVSVGGDHPRVATINAAYNNANGFLAQVLGNQVTRTVVDTVSVQLGEQVADQMLVGFNTIGEGMHASADGAGQLHEGTGRARDGATTLAEGAGQLRDEGIAPLADGAAQLADAAGDLSAGIGTARDGSGALADGLADLQQGTDRLGAGAAAVSGGVDKLVGIVNVGPLQELQQGAAEIQRQLTDPTAEYRAGVDRAVDAARQLNTGLHTLADGSEKLVIGTRSLADGTSRLVGASEQLTVGAAQLRDGLVELDTGSGELGLRLSDGASRVPQYDEDVRGDYATAMTTPVQERQTADTMTLFGVGLAPFFLSLGLFMGATVIFLILRALQRRALDSGAGVLRVVLASYLPALLIGLAQAVVMWAVLRWAVGIEAVNTAGLLVAMLGVSATFVAVTQAVNAFFGPAIGRVLCLVLMALQLVASGGLYPVETQPAFHRAVHHIDPMTYTVTLFRQMIVGPGDARVWSSAAVLAAVLAGALAVSAFSAYRSRTLRVKDLHPELAV